MSSTDDRSDWFDPRLTVFIIWGIFVILFVCIPSKRVVQRFCYMMGCTRCGGYEEGIAPTDNHGGGREMSYEILSNARKQEIDSLRASHLTYRLHPFSLTLEKKHMLRTTSEDGEDAEISTNATQNNNSNNKAMPQDRIHDPDDQYNEGDIETGFVRGIDPPEGDGGNDQEEEIKEEVGDGEEKQYTHVSVPLPGNNFDCVDVLELSAVKEDEKNNSSNNGNNKEEKKTKIRMFGGKGSKQQQDKDAKEEPDTTTDAKDKKRDGGKRRSCPIFCAICLAEYEVSERVSWSSNPECTHVFHEDCVVEWLVSLGKTKSKNLRLSEEPSEAQLLNYQLECPCCRQEFISRERCELPPLVGEVNA